MFLQENGAMIFALIIMGAIVVIALVRFFRSPSEEQLLKVREWLLYAVVEAEKQLGGGTGRLKLRMVYDKFAVRFPWLQRLISFETFSYLVDDALEEMREILITNSAVKEYVEGNKDLP